MAENYMELKVLSDSKNEAFARNVVAAFCVELNPTVDQIDDIKTAVSEAVTNCVVHGYAKGEPGEITIKAHIQNATLHIEVSDSGVGIADISEALQPYFTTRPDEERSGMGFTVMETFMDSLEVTSDPRVGTTVRMTKCLG
ncbi:MAG: anti-sigma F factor [Clostridiales bacterium]|jgi:stage II sporulation protein AB (anti-sigma F factor)|nr:anti-sigma F factor [Clostridiales bacterium]